MKRIPIFILLCIFVSTSYAQNKNLIDLLHNQEGNIESCYSQLENDTLIMGNAFMERRFKWNDGNLITTAIKNKISNDIILINKESVTDFEIKDLTTKIVDARYSAKKIKETNIKPQHLQIEIINKFESLELKRIFRIYPSSMAIGCEYYLKSTVENIEIEPEDIKAEHLHIPSRHWRLEAIEFFDNTDYRDNLVEKESIIACRRHKQKGNVLYLNHLLKPSGIFILKEAPCSFVQCNYPGFDFESKWFLRTNNIEISSSGLGVSGSDLIKDKWIKCYGYALGVHDNTEQNKLIALRSYHNNMRITKAERDEMIMVNTWGDFNKTEKIKEKFVIEEIIRAKEFGFTHYMIDVGWQAGRSIHSKVDGLMDNWEPKDWEVDKGRFPNDLDPIIALADSLDIKLGLWFHPSRINENAKWEQDADILIGLYKRYGIKYMKIDGVKTHTIKADLNQQKCFEKVLKETNGEMVLILDVTAGIRWGYHYNTHIGKTFLENRFTDWANYYPFKTLRNIWMLSSYVPLQNLQIEFLNIWRNPDHYKDDPLAPSLYSFDYIFAITTPAQPLAWLETTGLPKEAEKAIEWIKIFGSINTDLHDSYIFPIGNEPNGTSFTGFQFMQPGNKGYVLVFRELNNTDECQINTMFKNGQKIQFEKIYGNGKDFKSVAGDNGKINFKLKDKNSFCLYKYKF